MERKRFSHGHGRLDAQTLNEINRATDTVNNTPMPPVEAAWQGPYMALINPPNGVAKQVLETNSAGDPIKWGYDWIALSPLAPGELENANSPSYQSLGPEGNAATALNLAELNNNETTIMGVEVGNLPAGVKLQPVPGSTHVMIWVAPSVYVDGDTTTPGNQGFVAYFYYCNQFDGECQ